MMRISFIIVSMIMCCNLGFKAQGVVLVDTSSVSYYNELTTGQKQIMVDYKVTNDSEDEYVTWVSLDFVSNKTNNQLMHDFFNVRRGDFTFSEIIYEGTWDGSPIGYDIGFSFIKKILPGESFSYIILKSDSNSTLYKNKIVIMKRKEVEKFLGGTKIAEYFFYPLANIVLTEK